MSWRPEGWKNPYSSTGDREPSGFISTVRRDDFEAGADAMLESLKKKGAWMTPEQMRVLAPDRKYPYGWLVFIPEEKTAAESNVAKDVITNARENINERRGPG